jgi:hypothetical protein
MNKQEQVLYALSNAGLLYVQPGFPVEQRTIYGLCGDGSDLAFSIEWRDSAGCKWAADFAEESFATADVERNQITLKDSEGAPVRLGFFDLKAGEF